MNTNIEIDGNFRIGHLEVETRGLPFILKFDKGHMRAFCLSRKSSGEYVAFVGMSDVEAEAIEGNYEPSENEDVTAVLGLVIPTRKVAVMFQNFFRDIAKAMENVEEEQDAVD